MLPNLMCKNYTKDQGRGDTMAKISLYIDVDVKKQAEQVCTHVKMSLLTAISIYLKKMGREKCIPFEVSVDSFYSQENMIGLRKSVAQMDATGGTVHEKSFVY